MEVFLFSMDLSPFSNLYLFHFGFYFFLHSIMWPVCRGRNWCSTVLKGSPERSLGTNWYSFPDLREERGDVFWQRSHSK